MEMTITLKDFNTAVSGEKTSWEEHFADWRKTNAILVKYLYGELDNEEAEIVKKVISESNKYRLALEALEFDPDRSKYNAETFTKITEQGYKLVFRKYYQSLENG